MPVRKRAITKCNEYMYVKNINKERKNKNKLQKRPCFNSIKLETDTESKNKLVNVHK